MYRPIASTDRRIRCARIVCLRSIRSLDQAATSASSSVAIMSIITRNMTLGSFFVFVTFAFLCLWYMKLYESDTASKITKDDLISSKMTKEDPVSSAMKDTMTTTDQNTSDCRRLFSTKSLAHNFSMSKDYRDNIDEFLSVVDSHNVSKNHGHIYVVTFQFKLYHYLTSKLKFVRTVCETGTQCYCNCIRTFSTHITVATLLFKTILTV